MQTPVTHDSGESIARLAKPTYNPENKTVLERHQDCIKAIYACKTAADFDAIPTWIDQYILPDKNLETMQTVIDNQRRLLKVEASPATRAEQIAEEYKDVDAENFKTPVPTPEGTSQEGIWAPSIEEIAESGITIEVSGGTDAPVTVQVTDRTIGSGESTVKATTPAPAPAESTDPLDAIPEQKEPEIEAWIGVWIIDDTPKAKRTRKPKEETVQSVNNSMSITLKRRINLPIEGVQYSNNEFGCEVTASTKEEAQSLLEELMTEFMSDSGLVRKSTMNEMIAIEKNKAQTKEVIKEVEKVVYKRSSEDDLELRRYARVQLFMQALAKDATILPAMQRVKAEFEKTNPRF